MTTHACVSLFLLDIVPMVLSILLGVLLCFVIQGGASAWHQGLVHASL